VKVFLSYRRADDRFLAGRLRDRLSEAFGEENIFFDVDSIPPGTDFRTVTRERIDAADVVLALIGSHWDSTRLAETTDYVRMELGESLRQQKPLIPVLVDDTTMPRPDELPEDLAALPYLNALRIRPDPDFHDDCAELVAAVAQATEHGGAPANIEGARVEPSSQERARRRRWAAIAAAVAVVCGVAVLVWALTRDSSDSSGQRVIEISPTSGPAGTTIEFRGDGCPAGPEAAIRRGISYWLDSPSGQTLVSADVTSGYDASWSGSLVVPAGSSADGTYEVGAACYANYSDPSKDGNFYAYPPIQFTVTDS